MVEKIEPSESELLAVGNGLDQQDADLDNTAITQFRTQTLVNWACWNGEPTQGKETRHPAPKNYEDDGA